MTTVAFDGKTLAADSAMVDDGIKIQFDGKIRRLKNGSLIGFAGDVYSGLELMAWVAKGDFSTKPSIAKDADADADVVLITKKKTITFFNSRGTALKVLDTKITLGSGAVLAMGALLAGATAVEAVKIAIQRDPNSGFEPIFLDL